MSYLKYLTLITIIIFSGCHCLEFKQHSGLPKGFIYLKEIDPTIIQSVRYASNENFIGKKIDGYNTSEVILTHQAAKALRKIQAELNKHGYNLVVYDGYRPQQAVSNFMLWSKDLRDQKNKSLYYPTINKADVFKLGYVAEKSGHSRGSTVDLTIIPLGKSIQPIQVLHRKLKNGQIIPYLDDGTIDMGSSFDLFHEVSHHDTKLIDDQAMAKRNFLRNIMIKNGFNEYHEEWWHYTLANEPFPDAYFDFIVK